MKPYKDAQRPPPKGKSTLLRTLQVVGAPKPLGSYSHAIAYGDFLFLSGIASRDPITNQVPGLKMEEGKRVSYDIRAETRGTLENIRHILQAAGSGLERILDIQVYLTDMKDFGAYNEVFSDFFSEHKPTRTTVAVLGLPGDIAIEMKVVAAAGA
jgi:2-aminomuconate deaminase